MASEQQTLSILVKAKDLASKTIGKVNKSLAGIGTQAQRGVANAMANLKKLGMLGAGVGAVLAIGAVKFATSWEDAATSVRKTVDGNVEGILAGIRDMSRQIPIAAEDLAGIAASGGALGIANKDILEFTHTVALLSQTADDVSFETGAESLGHLRTTLGLTGQDFERFGSAVTALGNDGATTEGQILAMTERVAGAAHLVGLAKDETLGWAAALANTGMEVEAGGSSLQKFFLQSFKAVGKGGKALRIYSKVAGMSGAQFRKTMDKDFSGAMERFIVGLGKLDEQQQLAVLDDLGFTDIRITRALLSLTGNTDNLTKSLGLSQKAWKQNNAMTQEAEKRFNTFQSAILILKNNLKDVGITMGTAVLPTLNKVTRRFNEWLADPEQQRNLQSLATDVGTEFDKLVGKAEAFIGTVDWDKVVSDLRAVATFSSQALSQALAVFNSAPDWLKTAVLTGWGLNKLTGGVFGTIVGELSKGLIKGVLGITAATVNVFGKTIGGGGLAPAGQAGSTRVASALAIGSAVFTIGSAVLVAQEVITDVQKNQAVVTEQQKQHRSLDADSQLASLREQITGFRNLLETQGDPLFGALRDFTNQASLRPIQSNVDEAILGPIESILKDGNASQQQVEQALWLIKAAEDLNNDHAVLSLAATDRLQELEKGVQTRLGTMSGQFTTQIQSTRDVESAVNNKDLRVTVPVTVNTETTVSGRDTQNTLTKQLVRMGFR